MYRFILILFIVLFTISCVKKNKHSTSLTSPEELFESNKLIVGQKLNISSDSIRYVYSLTTIGDSLLILSDNNDSFHFSLIDLYTDTMVGRFGKIGDGPNEISFPTSIQVLPSTKSVGFYVMNQWLYYEHSLEDIIKGQGQPYLKLGRFDVNHQRLFKLRDSTFIGVGYFKNRFAISNEKGDVIEQMQQYPFEEILGQNTNSLAMAYQGNFSMSPNGKNLCFATIYSPNLSFIHLDDSKVVKNIDTLYSWPPIFVGSEGNVISIDFEKENILGYQSVATTNDRVYLLYSGKKLSEKEPYQSNVVLVFDWYGKPIIKYKLDKQLSQITVDSKGKVLYGFVDEMKPYIIKYML